MAYQANIPLATDLIKNSQDDILKNFQAINTLIDVNHVIFDLVDQGKHKWVTFPVQTSAPAFLVTETGLFSKVPAAPFPLTTVQEVFVHRQTTSGGENIPFTASILSYDVPSSSSNGWTYLPSGIILKWGQATAVNAVANQTILFPVAPEIPVFNFCYRVYISELKNLVSPADVFVITGSLTGISFDVSNIGALNPAVDFQYLAIGG